MATMALLALERLRLCPSFSCISYQLNGEFNVVVGLLAAANLVVASLQEAAIVAQGEHEDEGADVPVLMDGGEYAHVAKAFQELEEVP